MARVAGDHPGSPVKVRVYGLFPLTRRAYLVLQVLAIGFLVALWWGAGWAAEVFALPLLGVLAWVFLLGVGAELLETLVVLRKFAEKERSAEADRAIADLVRSESPGVNDTEESRAN